jgi:hypothetical protein
MDGASPTLTETYIGFHCIWANINYISKKNIYTKIVDVNEVYILYHLPIMNFK